MTQSARLRKTAERVLGKLTRQKPKARHSRAAVPAPVDSQILLTLGIPDGATVSDVVRVIKNLLKSMQGKVRKAMVRDDAQRAVAAALNAPLSRIRKDGAVVRKAHR